MSAPRTCWRSAMRPASSSGRSVLGTVMGKEHVLERGLVARQVERLRSGDRLERRRRRAVDLEAHAVVFDSETFDARHVIELRWPALERGFESHGREVAKLLEGSLFDKPAPPQQ